jgi:soluble lytic murein transglycosylase-like protein
VRLWYLVLVLAFLAGVLFGVSLSARPARAQSAEVAEAIHEASATYGVSERWMRSIAWCESRFSPGVTSRGGHAGLYQYSWSTWRTLSARAGYPETSPYDPWSAAMVTAWALRNGFSSHWSCA